MSNILLIGANGTIGKAAADLLEQGHHIIRVGHSQGDYTVDLSQKASIGKLLEEIETFDAVVCTGGVSRFGKLTDVSDEDFSFSIHNKLMGQINLVRAAVKQIPANSSITLTTGMLGQTPGPGTVPTATVNAALEGFVRAAALDLPDIRINAVSPIFVTETAAKMGIDPPGTMSAAETAKAYEAAVEGEMTGKILDVRDFGKTV